MQHTHYQLLALHHLPSPAIQRWPTSGDPRRSPGKGGPKLALKLKATAARFLECALASGLQAMGPKKMIIDIERAKWFLATLSTGTPTRSRVSSSSLASGKLTCAAISYFDPALPSASLSLVWCRSTRAAQAPSSWEWLRRVRTQGNQSSEQGGV